MEIPQSSAARDVETDSGSKMGPLSLSCSSRRRAAGPASPSSATHHSSGRLARGQGLLLGGLWSQGPQSRKGCCLVRGPGAFMPCHPHPPTHKSASSSVNLTKQGPVPSKTQVSTFLSAKRANKASQGPGKVGEVTLVHAPGAQ
jgi:hypothetical protein